jgi:hypothetical protein
MLRPPRPLARRRRSKIRFVLIFFSGVARIVEKITAKGA